jgi:hypothetical protein
MYPSPSHIKRVHQMSEEIDLIAEFEQELADEGRAGYLKAIAGYSDAWQSGDFEKAVVCATEMLNISTSDPALKEFRKQASDYLEAAKDARDKTLG